MIYKCERCLNNANCCENQKKYKALCKKIEKIKKLKKFHCWYWLNLKCAYFVDVQKEVWNIESTKKS